LLTSTIWPKALAHATRGKVDIDIGVKTSIGELVSGTAIRSAEGGLSAGVLIGRHCIMDLNSNSTIADEGGSLRCAK
jgi:hypothetical protein